MKGFLHRLTHKSSAVLSIFVFILFLSITFGIVAISEYYYQEDETERARLVSSSQAGKIQHVIESLLFTSRTVGILVEEGGGEIRNFEAVMKTILDEYPIQNIALAPNGIVNQIYPLEGNEEAMGHNLLEDPARSTEALAAEESKALTLAGPYELVQGGFGAIGRLPIYLTDENDKEYFWGFICVTLKFPDALKDAQLGNLEAYQYSYELWKKNPDTHEKIVITRSQKALNGKPLESSFNLPNTTWTLSITPESGWCNKLFLILKIIDALSFSILLTLLCKNVLELARNRNELNYTIQQQSDNYRQLNTLNEKLRSFRHDMKNHMLSISSLIELQDLESAKSYINDISDTLTSTQKIINTENFVFDALLAKKTAKAKEKNIIVESEIFIRKNLKISNQHWSILFGNILDNAIEACESVTDTLPHIHIFMQSKGNILHVRVSNTTNMPDLPANSILKTTKRDSINHGMGLMTISHVVKQYKGTLEIQCKNGIFTISFLLFNV